MRIILFTGKGGVGKTSLSAATAIACARGGKRTIVLSTDVAHSLADVLGRPIGSEPVEIEPNLAAQEISVHTEIRRNWGKIQSYLTRFLASQGYQEAVAEELAVWPGMEDLFSLIKLLDIEAAGQHDVAIIDCAPTGSTLQLLSLADVLQWYMKKFYDIEKKIALTIKPIAERLIKAPLPDREVYTSIEHIYARVMAVKEMLTNPETSSIRLVTNPEKIVIQETQRAHTYLSIFGFPVDAVIANRVLPKKASTGFLKEWARLQKEYMIRIREAFAPLPILTAPFFPSEIIGPDALAAMAAAVYGDRLPSDIFWKDRPFLLESRPEGYEMAIALPGVEKNEINLWAKKEELIIKVGEFQRNLLLPRVLEGHAVTKAKLEDGYFRILFEKGHK